MIWTRDQDLEGKTNHVGRLSRWALPVVILQKVGEKTWAMLHANSGHRIVADGVLDARKEAEMLIGARKAK